MNRTRTLLAATLITTLGACTSAEPAPAADPPAAAPAGTATSAPVPAEPVASLEIDTTTAMDDVVTVRFDVVSLERDGDTARLAMRITNLSDEFEYRPLADLAASQVSDFTLSGVSLIDLTANLRHLVLTDSAGDCVCSDLGSVTLTSGAGVDAQASFPAPAADEVDIQLGELGILPDAPLADR